MVERLLKVEHSDEPTEIVVHVNMLKEGWDVTNLYTIVPLRAANARILIEQSIGRGLRLPYGKRTGIAAVDRLNIIAHDKFQEIIDEAKRPDSAIRLQQIILPPDGIHEKTVTVISAPVLETMLGLPDQTSFQEPNLTGVGKPVRFGEQAAAPVFETPQEAAIAKLTIDEIRGFANQPQHVPTSAYLQNENVQTRIAQVVAAQYRPLQMAIETVVPQPDIAQVVAKTTALFIAKTIAIPSIRVVPKGEVRAGFKPFALALNTLNYQPPSGDLWIKYLRTDEHEILGLGESGNQEARLVDYIVSGLIEYDDVSYDDHADLLYDLAGQVVQHFRRYLDEQDTRKVLRFHQKQIAQFVHA